MSVTHKREAYRYVAELLALALRDDAGTPLPSPSTTPEVRAALEQIRSAMLSAGSEQTG